MVLLRPRVLIHKRVPPLQGTPSICYTKPQALNFHLSPGLIKRHIARLHGPTLDGADNQVLRMRCTDRLDRRDGAPIAGKS